MEVSVVIPSFNRAALLPITLRTILAQTLAPHEIIVVDDGSTDTTASVLACFAPRVSTLRIANAGSIVARNVGLRAASGAFVAFCDSDDLWQPDFLQRMAALWRAESRTSVAYANFRIVAGERWTDGTKFDAAPAGFWQGLRRVGEGLGVFDEPIVGRLLAFQPFFPSAMIVPRQGLLDAGGWDEGAGRTVGDDFGTALRMAELTPFGVVQEPLVGIRKHAGNFSADVRRMNLGDANVLEYVLATRPSLAGHRAAIEDSIARRRVAALDAAFVDGDFAAVRAVYARLPPGFRSGRVRLKRSLASLPVGPAGRIVRRLIRGRRGG
jgi:glycosyltransferase involved in cell wall biosynthesis